MIVSKHFLQAANETWQAIGPDAEEFCNDDEDRWEMILDVNRIETYGNADAGFELLLLLQNHDFPDIITYLANNHPL